VTEEPTLYRPSNGTAGEGFHARFCYRCGRNWEKCSILTRTLIHSIDEPEYPREWIQDDQGARCTAFRERVFNRQSNRFKKIRDKRQEKMKL